MGRILVVEDMEIFREPIAAALRNHGYKATCAKNGEEALVSLDFSVPDLILLDLVMPAMDGLTLLRQVRNHPRWKELPVILLTSSGDKESVVEAGKLKINGYVLKTNFSLDSMLQLVDETIQKRKSNAETAGSRGTLAGQNTSETSPEISRPNSLLRSKRETTIERAKKCVMTKTLSVAAAEVMALASSGSAETSDLATIVASDPVLTARVLHAANSAAFTRKKSYVADMNEAVQRLGLDAVCEIASEVGIFDAFQVSPTDDRSLFRCWQHSLAVALTMTRLTNASHSVSSGLSHLVGLCHGLADIVVRQEFHAEYPAISSEAAAKHISFADAEQHALGISLRELSGILLPLLGLPPAIMAPIAEHLEALGGHSSASISKMGRLLNLANSYAHALLFSPSPDAQVAPILRTEYEKAIGTSHSVMLNNTEIQTGVINAFSAVTKELSKPLNPLFAQRDVKIWYTRQAEFSDFDPLLTALQSLANPECHEELPATLEECNGHQGIVIVASKLDSATLNKLKLLQQLGNSIPILLLTAGDVPNTSFPHLQCESYPISLRHLDSYLSTHFS